MVVKVCWEPGCRAISVRHVEVEKEGFVGTFLSLQMKIELLTRTISRLCMRDHARREVLESTSRQQMDSTLEETLGSVLARGSLSLRKLPRVLCERLDQKVRRTSYIIERATSFDNL